MRSVPIVRPAHPDTAASQAVRSRRRAVATVCPINRGVGVFAKIDVDPHDRVGFRSAKERRSQSFVIESVRFRAGTRHRCRCLDVRRHRRRPPTRRQPPAAFDPPRFQRQTACTETGLRIGRRIDHLNAGGQEMTSFAERQFVGNGKRVDAFLSGTAVANPSGVWGPLPSEAACSLRQRWRSRSPLRSGWLVRLGTESESLRPAALPSLGFPGRSCRKIPSSSRKYSVGVSSYV